MPRRWSPFKRNGDRWFLKGNVRVRLQCFVDDCEKPMTRHVKDSLYCTMHVERMKRNGSIDRSVRSSEEIVFDVESVTQGYGDGYKVSMATVAEKLGMKPDAIYKALKRAKRWDLVRKIRPIGVVPRSELWRYQDPVRGGPMKASERVVNE